jgi:hypothetical protein
VLVVAELAEDPGAEDLADPGLAAVDRCRAVLVEQGLGLLPEPADLGVECGDDRAAGLDQSCVGGDELRGELQLLAGECGVDLFGAA